MERLERRARAHPALVALVAVSVLVRVLVEVAYWPALFFSDSWAYLDMAHREFPVGVAFDRPSGYPMLIRVLSAGGGLATLTVAQHLAGLAAGVLAYALLLRLGVRRWVAAAVAGVILLDGYAIALAQHVMPEAAFALVLLVAALLTVEGRRRPALLLAGGVVLGAAVSLRTAALFAVPAWLAYALYAAPSPRWRVVAATAVATPILAYAALHAAVTGRFGITEADGWFLYGRVGEIGECNGVEVPAEARGLCARPAEADDRGAGWYIYDRESPARREFGGIGTDREKLERSNEVLKEYAVAIVKDRPHRYAGMVAVDFLRYFDPWSSSRGNSDLAIELPDEPRGAYLDVTLRDRWAPGYEPRAEAPAGLLRAYRSVVHTPRLLSGLALLLALAAGIAALRDRRRRRTPPAGRRTAEILLLAGAAVGMLVGSVATSEFIVRYLVPVAPLLLCAGALAATDLAARGRGPIVVRALPAGLRVRYPRPADRAGRSDDPASHDDAPALPPVPARRR